MNVLTVNVGVPRAIESKAGTSAIDKRPVDHPVKVTAPQAGHSGVSGDHICDVDNHGGEDQAVYAYAREDLDRWQAKLSTTLANGAFGENLTTDGIDLTNAEVGERWRVGTAELQVTVPRIPCRTFAVWLDQQGWVKTFTNAAVPGAYLKVLTPGEIKAGDAIEVVHRPGHGVTMGLTFRALTTEPELLPDLLRADDLPAETRQRVEARLVR
ncbi:MOSC domain-containing protein [Actinokineospora sp. HUAS TT18]|uniref:MOSC domain-containing protein n=1 Tax=Actinokineospora sp. HUAS TT18 TaxID=3447451 RepID=UPI003F522438